MVALRSYALSGSVNRVTPGPVDVVVQRQSGSRWVTYGRDRVDARGGWSVPFSTNNPKRYVFRAVATWGDAKRATSKQLARTVVARPDVSVSGPLSSSDVRWSYRAGCPVTPSGLRRITINRFTYGRVVARGSLVVRAAAVPDLVKVFTNAFSARFPLRSMRPSDVFYAGGRRTPTQSDLAAMRADNTSAFNCRPVTGNPYRVSQHSYGNAIDINTVRNPYVVGSRVYPPVRPDVPATLQRPHGDDHQPRRHRQRRCVGSAGPGVHGGATPTTSTSRPTAGSAGRAWDARGMTQSPPTVAHPTLGRQLLVVEVLLVLALSLGRSGVYALVNLIASATAPGTLSSQKAVLNGSLAPGRPWLDLTYQLLALFFGVVPVLLVGYLLTRSDDHPRSLWSSGVAEHRRDALRGLVLAAVVGGTGLAFYLVTYALGVNLTVVAEDLPAVWWRYPVLLLSALQNALLEEFVVVGYLILRLRQIGLRDQWAIGTSALSAGATTSTRGSAASSGTPSWACCSGGCTPAGAGSRRWSSHTRCSTCSRSSATPCSPVT